ncbi:hypothetical protein PAXRUDRAFT_162226, partial [Paxillus rubicundulus Ve08.2h10]
GAVSLQMEWCQGAEAAKGALKVLNVLVDIVALFADRSVDFMKPMGDGKYPGVSQDFNHTKVKFDDSQSSSTITPALGHNGTATTTPHNYELSGILTGLAEDVDMPASDAHPGAPDGEDGSELDDNSDSLELEVVADESQGIVITTKTKDTPTITLEDLIPEPGESDEDDASKNWLDFKGKKIHNVSVI